MTSYCDEDDKNIVSTYEFFYIYLHLDIGKSPHICNCTSKFENAKGINMSDQEAAIVTHSSFVFCLREDSHMAGYTMKEVTVYTTVFNLLVCVLLVL